MDKHLHIICLNVPYPVDYGGVFDLFYKLPALQQQGVKIHLHCFEYGRGEQPELNKYCESVHYYKRKTGIKGISIRYPYIVSSRSNKTLLQKLTEDDYPILMEGIHCTYLLNDKRFNQRRCFIRLHNVEHIYYRHLYCNTTSVFKKVYFFLESKILNRYEKKIAAKGTFWSVTEKDAETYRKLGCGKIKFLPLFLPPWTIRTSEGKGSFCLYHGDLGVAENEKAAIWLMKYVFNYLQIPFVIAGKDPTQRVAKLFHKTNTTCLIANPNEKEMQDLISKAHINIIPSFNSTGIKLKLINALFNGRHCIVNEQTIEGTNLEKACQIATDANTFKLLIQQLYGQPFTRDDLNIRHQLLDNMFNNEKNAKQIVEWIWE
ncbi:glycosyltransferase [Segetibacter koreensis]|uniref:glycosyltransferase n=1 Tax=Segetibacter koreensis TaxID=398037 RepID=UPI00035D964C|nr:glycosyltransferase [Segetibacter koreensis]